MGYASGFKVEVEKGGVKAALILARRRSLPLAKMTHLSGGYRVLVLLSAEDLYKVSRMLGL